MRSRSAEEGVHGTDARDPLEKYPERPVHRWFEPGASRTREAAEDLSVLANGSLEELLSGENRGCSSSA